MVEHVGSQEGQLVIGKVTSIVRLRINSDGAGVRSAVFLYGCPLNCLWCCNPETRFGQRYQQITPMELYRLIQRDIPYFQESKGGVTFSGGEPLMQHRFILEFARIVQGAFSINIETSLYAPQAVITELAPLIDHWYVDFKGPSGLHREHTGVECLPIRENLAHLRSLLDPEKITLTFPLIPECTDTRQSVEELTDLASRLGIMEFELHPYRHTSVEKYQKMGLNFHQFQTLPEEHLRQVRSWLLSAGLRERGAERVAERKKCRQLKQIRRTLVERFGIPLTIRECTYQGRCPGTCPACEKELSGINRWLREHNAGVGKETIYATD